MNTDAQPDGYVKDPGMGADVKPADLRAFITSRRPYESPFRARRVSTWNKATLMREGHTWLEPVAGDPRRASNYVDVQFDEDDESAIPLPSDPEITVCLQNESARLGRPDFKAYVRPTGEDPDTKARTGAQLTEQVILHRLREMCFDEVESEFDVHMPTWGQGILVSEWDTDRLKSTRIPVVVARACPRNPGAHAELPPPPAAAPEQPAPPSDGLAGDEPGLEAQGGDLSALVEGGEPDQTVVFPPDDLEQELDPTQPVDDPMQPAAPAPCDFTTARPEIDVETALRQPPEAIESYETKGAGGGMTLGHRLTRCPTCPDHPELVDYMPTMAEAHTGKDAFGRDLGEDKALGEWTVRCVLPHNLFPQGMGVNVKPRNWHWWIETTPMPLQWIRDRWENGYKVKAEQASALMQWHALPGMQSIGDTGEAGQYRDFARVTWYHRKPGIGEDGKADKGRTIILAGDETMENGTFLLPSRTVPGEWFPRVHIEVTPWEVRSHESWGLGMAELLFSLQEQICELLSMDSDALARMGAIGLIETVGMDTECVSFESGGFSGKRFVFTPDPAFPSQEPKPFGGVQMQGIIERLDWLIGRMNAVAGTSEAEGGSPPSGITAALALQYLLQQSGLKRQPRIDRKRESLERIYRHGATLMYHRTLEERTLEFQDDDKQWKQRAWRGTEMNNQLNVRIDPEPEHDSPLLKKQQILDMVDKHLYDLNDAAVRSRLVEALEGPRSIEGPMGMQIEAAQREFCDFRDSKGKWAPTVDPSMDDARSHMDEHGKSWHSSWMRDQRELARWEEIAPLLYAWEGVFAQLSAGLPPNFPPSIELRIFAVFDLILGMQHVTAEDLPPEQAAALKIVLRWRAHFEAHKDTATKQLSAATAGAAVVAAPESEQATAAGTVATATAPPEAVTQPGVQQAPQPAMAG